MLLEGRKTVEHIDRLGRIWKKQLSIMICDQCHAKFERKYTAMLEARKHHFCSRECQNESKSSGVLKEKIAKTNIRRYGVTSTLKTQPALAALKNVLVRKGDEIVKKRFDTIKRRFGPDGLAAVEIREKVKKTVRARYGFDHVSQVPEVSEKMSIAIANTMSLGKSIAYKDGRFESKKNEMTLYFRSSWERAFMEFLELDNDVASYEYETLKIEYMFDGKRRRYIPDFLVTTTNGTKKMYELKPEFRVMEEKTIVKTAAAIAYCQENGISEYCLLTKKELEGMGVLKRPSHVVTA